MTPRRWGMREGCCSKSIVQCRDDVVDRRTQTGKVPRKLRIKETKKQVGDACVDRVGQVVLKIPSGGERSEKVKSKLLIRPYQSEDEEAVIDLWERCELTRPWNDPRKDIRRKLEVRPDLFLVGEIGGAVVATIMIGYEGHRGWINYLAVAPDYRRRGIGRMLMTEAERLLRNEGCPKINLQVREENEAVIEFYRQLGYTIDRVVSMGKRLEHD